MNTKYTYLLIIVFGILISLVLHYQIFSYDLIGYHVWRQTQTQTVIENFCSQDFNILNPRLNNLIYPDGILRMEFPLYQWLVASFCKASANHVLTTRILTFLISILSAIGFFFLSNEIFKNKVIAAVSFWMLLFSPVFYYYMINPLPDNLALCFGIYTLFFFVKFIRENSAKYFIFFGITLCLATLCKLPFILFSVPFLIYWFNNRSRLKEMIILAVCLLPAVIWYGAVISTWQGNGIVKGIFNGGFDVLTYLDYIQHNFISTLPELYINFAALLLFASGVFYLIKDKMWIQSRLVLYFLSGLLAVIAYTLFELNMIAKVHDYYLFPYLPFLFLISPYGFLKLRTNKLTYIRILAVLCVILMPLTAYLRSNTRWNLLKPGFNSALLINKKEIQNIVPANAICLTGNDDSGMINLYYLNRKGYVFAEDHMNIELLELYKKNGVTYFISDATLDEKTSTYLNKPVAVFKDLKIYKLNN